MTEAENQMRQEDALKRLSQEWVPLLKPIDPRSQWMGEEVYNAYPIHRTVRNINPTSLQAGVQVMENFAGVGLGILRMTVAACIVVRIYTYIARDPVNRKIARHILLQLQLQHQKLILQSAIESFDRMYMPQDISLVGPAALTNLVAHYGLVDILGGSWECQSVSRAGRCRGVEDPRFRFFFDLVRIINFF